MEEPGESRPPLGGGEPAGLAGRRGRPGRPRRAEADEQIKAATRSLLSTRGYSGTSIEAVAARAKVGRPTVYRRWATKPELIMAAFGAELVWGPVADTGGLDSDLEVLEGTALSGLSSPEVRAALGGLMVDSHQDPQLRQRVRDDCVGSWATALDVIAGRAVARGELRADAHPPTVAELMAAVILHRALLADELDAGDLREALEAVMAAWRTELAAHTFTVTLAPELVSKLSGERAGIAQVASLVAQALNEASSRPGSSPLPKQVVLTVLDPGRDGP